MYHGEAASNLSPVLDILSILTVALVNTGLLLQKTALVLLWLISNTFRNWRLSWCCFLSLQVTNVLLPTKPNKTTNWTLKLHQRPRAVCWSNSRLALNDISLWSNQIWDIPCLDIDRTLSCCGGDTPEGTLINRAPSRGTLRGSHQKEHVLEVVHLSWTSGRLWL